MKKREIFRAQTSRISYHDSIQIDILVELAKPAFTGTLDERTMPLAYREQKCLVTYC